MDYDEINLCNTVKAGGRLRRNKRKGQDGSPAPPGISVPDRETTAGRNSGRLAVELAARARAAKPRSST